MSEEYLDTNNNSNAVNKMMTRLMNATASLHSSSNNHGGSGEATPLIVATAAAGSTVNESGAASSSSSSSLTSLIKVSSTVSVCASPGRLRTRDGGSTFTFRSGIHSYCAILFSLSFVSYFRSVSAGTHRSPRLSHCSGKT